LSLAACSAVLDVYKQEPIIETLWKRGKRFQDGVNAAILELDVPAVCDGFAVKPRIRFLCEDSLDNPGATNNLALSLFVQQLAAHGVLWHPAGGNISAAMTEQDIIFALDCVKAAFLTVRHALDTGDWSALKGKPIQPSKFVRGGA
jgi:glutamate-1-semialdehyde 2,1-aminomutase